MSKVAVATQEHGQAWTKPYRWLLFSSSQQHTCSTDVIEFPQNLQAIGTDAVTWLPPAAGHMGFPPKYDVYIVSSLSSKVDDKYPKLNRL
jgi:hypothetical protein